MSQTWSTSLAMSWAVARADAPVKEWVANGSPPSGYQTLA
jgi:hypothetical protein